MKASQPEKLRLWRLDAHKWAPWVKEDLSEIPSHTHWKFQIPAEIQMLLSISDFKTALDKYNITPILWLFSNALALVMAA